MTPAKFSAYGVSRYVRIVPTHEAAEPFGERRVSHLPLSASIMEPEEARALAAQLEEAAVDCERYRMNERARRAS